MLIAQDADHHNPNPSFAFVVQDVCGLRDHAARRQLESGWREVWGRPDFLGRREYLHEVGGLLGVGNPRVFERETNVLSTPRQPRPLSWIENQYLEC